MLGKPSFANLSSVALAKEEATEGNEKGLPVREGLLKFYVVTYITLQTFPQECFFVRFVCFITIMFLSGPPSSIYPP
jgi:hypothetical protein